MADINDSLPVDIAGVKGGVLDVVYLSDVSACVDASAFKYLTAYSSRKNDRSGESARKMTASTDIIEAVISHSTCVICVTGAGKMRYVLVII